MITAVRAVVRKHRESGARSKKSIFFYITKKTLLVNYFQKQMNIQKFQRSSVFAKNHKLHAVNPGSISGRFFLSAHCRCGVFLDSALMQESFLTLYALPGYTVYTCIYFSKSPSPLPHHPFTTSEMVGPTDRGKHAYFISFVTQHMLHVSVTGKMHVICIRNFVTYTGLMKTSIKATYTDNSRTLSNEILWYLRSPDNRSIRICIVLPEITSKLPLQCLLYSNLIFSLSRAAAV